MQAIGRSSGGFRIWFLAFGYFAFYIPYSGLTKALTQGLLPGVSGSVSGFEILPATVVATSAVLLAFVAYGGAGAMPGRIRLGRFAVLAARRATFASGVATAVIIAATTINYTFAGLSILLVLLLMRGGVLLLSPLADRLSGRAVQATSWVALGFSLAAVAVAFSNVTSYRMTTLAALNTGAYLGGYLVRLNIMSRLAKQPDPAVNRRYFYEETLVAAVALTAIPAMLALFLPGPIGDELRTGFTSFVATPAFWPSIMIGLLYGCLYLFGSWVYLDPRENTFTVPMNRCASLLSGVVASYVLAFGLGRNPPTATELAGVGLIVAALGTLMASTLAARGCGQAVPQRIFLFVCGGNTSRSPMAQAICNAEVARWLGLDAVAVAPVLALSAGLSTKPGTPFTAPASAALGRLGVAAQDHASRDITPDLVDLAEVIYCMTEDQRTTLSGLFPAASAKIRRLDPDADLPDPSGQGDGLYEELAARLQQLVRSRVLAVAG